MCDLLCLLLKKIHLRLCIVRGVQLLKYKYLLMALVLKTKTVSCRKYKGIVGTEYIFCFEIQKSVPSI